MMMGDTIGPMDLINTERNGTLGLFLTDAFGKVYLMSNYHVLPVQRKILQIRYNQPTRLSSFIVAEFIPELSYRGTLQFTIGRKKYDFGMDLGIAELRLNKKQFIPQPRQSLFGNHKIVMNSRIGTPTQKEYVYKCGAKSDLTKGMVTITNLPVRSTSYSTLLRENYPGKATVFCNQVMFMRLSSSEPFCAFGDSDSIVINEDRLPYCMERLNICNIPLELI